MGFHELNKENISEKPINFFFLGLQERFITQIIKKE